MNKLMKTKKIFLILVLFAFGTQLFAQSTLFQRDEQMLIGFKNGVQRGEVPDNPGGDNPGGGGEEPTPGSPLGSGIAILLGCATLYACTRRKKEN